MSKRRFVVSTKPCPKCGTPAHRARTGKERAMEGVHVAAHAAHAHPLFALVTLALSAVSATGALDRYACPKCGHTF
jgi:predicted RNA-binding Zn-ribbon protein involved in translation (DUF1610 family)